MLHKYIKMNELKFGALIPEQLSEVFKANLSHNDKKNIAAKISHVYEGSCSFRTVRSVIERDRNLTEGNLAIIDEAKKLSVKNIKTKNRIGEKHLEYLNTISVKPLKQVS